MINTENSNVKNTQELHKEVLYSNSEIQKVYN